MTSYAQIQANNDAIAKRNAARKPGPKTPQKYPVSPGPNYNIYGEQSGYIYNPYTDKYVPDPKVAGPYYGQPDAAKPPTLAQQIGMPAAILGTAGIATEGAKMLPGLLGSGAAAAPVATTTGSVVGAAPGALLGAGSAGEVGTLAGAPEVAAAYPGAGLLGVGALPLAAIAGGTYLGGKAGYDMLQGKKPGLPGRIILGMATGGLSEVANHFLGAHKSTHERQADNTSGLMGIGQDDAAYQDYVRGARDQNINGRPDGEKAFDGKYDTWDQYVKGGLDASNLTGVLGNIQAGGPDWAHYTEDQRRAITQKNIDAGNYASKDGEVVVVDPSKWNAARDSVIGAAPTAGVVTATPSPVAGTQAVTVMNQPAPIAPAPGVVFRSQTRSPGIDLNGNRINYLR